MKVRGIRTLWAVVLSLVIMFACLSVRNVDASPRVATMSVEPHVVSADVGSIFTVDIMVENIEPMGFPPVACYGWQVHMNWSTAVLNFSSHYYDYYGKTVTIAHLTFGDFFVDAPHGSNEFKSVNYGAGYTEFGASMLGDASEDREGTSGSGWLATCEFKVVGTGETDIDIEYGYNVEPYALTFVMTYYSEEMEVVPENGHFINVPSPWPIDLNKDGRIDIRDIARVSIKWGWEGTPGSIPEDVNDDGYVDIADLTAVATEYGTQYYP